MTITRPAAGPRSRPPGTLNHSWRSCGVRRAIHSVAGQLKASWGLVRRRLEPRESRRRLEQQRQELPVCEPQQQRAREPQQQPGLPCLSSSTDRGARPPNRTRSRPRPDAGQGGAKPCCPAGLVGFLGEKARRPRRAVLHVRNIPHHFVPRATRRSRPGEYTGWAMQHY